MDQVSYLQGFHRSGWPFVLRNLMKLQDDDGIWCDTYVDRTFHWAKPEIIPYTRPWIGFVHHTFNTSFSDYNNVNLLKNEDFLRSLVHCKGIFVFSSIQANKWKNQLRKRGFVNVPVQALTHPTQFVDKKFTIEAFQKNDKKKLVQIGAWLRDNYAIYALNNGNSTFSLGDGQVVKKSALIGPQMQSYFKPLGFFRLFRKPQWKKGELVPSNLKFSSTKKTFKGENSSEDTPIVENSLSINGEIPQNVLDNAALSGGDGEGMCRDAICRDIMCRDSDYGLNKYVQGSINLLKSFDDSVALLPTFSDDEYDTLLSQNVVFLKMVDAAAVNTILECMVRNTPMVINRIPAVVELLGEHYPLFYDNAEEVPGILTMDNIIAAYEYLVELDKSSLTADKFINDLTNSAIYENL